MTPADELELPAIIICATGAGRPTKWSPSSVVLTIEVQTGLVHGASPSNQYWLADMAVNETGSNPFGTGPPAGAPPITVCSVTDLVVGVVLVDKEEEVVAGAALVVGDVVAGVAVVAGGRVVEVGGAALLPALPQPAAKMPTDSNTPQEPTNFLLVTVLLTLGRVRGFPGGPTLVPPRQMGDASVPREPPALSTKS